MMRQIGVFVALLLALLYPMATGMARAIPMAQGTPVAQSTSALVAPSTRDEKMRMEADYILACQYLGSGTAHGALNNVYGAPTWVVPRENGVAIMALLVAAEVLGENKYRIGAQRAGDYLVKMQQQDGCWCNQYVYMSPADMNKSPTQTAEVMMALFRLGYLGNTLDPHDRYDAMKNGAQCLLSFQAVANKEGQDDGLLGGGKDAEGRYLRWRWTHDNAYAYWALRMAAQWASWGGEKEFAAQCNAGAKRIASGLMAHLFNDSTGVWHVAIDESGAPQWPSGLENRPNWIQYAPLMLDVPLAVDGAHVGEWIRTTFQQEDGSSIGWALDGGDQAMNKYPGYAFQSSLVWLDIARTNPTQGTYAQAAINWAETSGLWQTEPDDQGVTGGWIDWVEVTPNAGHTAATWERFIDTSAYAILTWNGGYHFGIFEVSLPLTQNRTRK